VPKTHDAGHTLNFPSLATAATFRDEQARWLRWLLQFAEEDLGDVSEKRWGSC